MSQSEIPVLKEYIQSLENQNQALSQECALTQQHLKSLEIDYARLESTHNLSAQQLQNKEQEIANMHEYYRVQMSTLQQQLQTFVDTRDKSIKQSTCNPSITQNSTGIMFSGLHSIVEGRFNNLQTDKADLMHNHIQTVLGFRNSLACLYNEVYSVNENRSQSPQHNIIINPLMVSIEVQTQSIEVLDLDLEMLVKQISELQNKLNNLAQQLGHKDYQLIKLTQSQSEYKHKVVELEQRLKRGYMLRKILEKNEANQCITIEAILQQDNVPITSEMYIKNDLYEEEEVVVFPPQSLQSKHQPNPYIYEIEHIEVKHNDNYELGIDTSCQPTLKRPLPSISINYMKQDTQPKNLYIPMIQRLTHLIKSLECHTRPEVSELVSLANILLAQAESLQRIHVTICKQMQCHIIKDSKHTKNSKTSHITCENPLTSLDLIASQDSSPSQNKTSCNYSKFIKPSEYSFFADKHMPNNRLSRSDQFTSETFRRLNISDMMTRIKDLRIDHQQRKRHSPIHQI